MANLVHCMKTTQEEAVIPNSYIWENGWSN